MFCIPTMTSPDSVVMALNPALWLDARRLAGASGDAVTTWLDRSGNGRNASQANAAKKPTAQHAVSGPGDVARFDGGDCLQTAAIDLTANVAATLAAAADNRSGALAAAIIVESSASFSVNVGAMLLAYSVTILDDVEFGHRGNVGAEFKITTAAQSGFKRLLMTSNFAAAAGSEVTAFVNNSTPTTADVPVENTGTSHGNHVFNIGARNDAASLPLTGDIAHVLLFTSALSAGQRTALDDALASMGA